MLTLYISAPPFRREREENRREGRERCDVLCDKNRVERLEDKPGENRCSKKLSFEDLQTQNTTLSN